ncbi:CKLF-like MARVEL transmembrane domain-containing protein 7 [Liolophura sinensis]|uniref:CKLF-like MARVEL transmembrane domain-containing protein 7 n=1 Tax=Liolophura sinensis TaxID=3198878 RepID=UPI003158CD6A
MADDMPNKYSYDAQTTSPTAESQAIGPDVSYIKTLPGILKIAEIVLSIIAFICATVYPWAYGGGGWVQFVTISTFVGVLVLFIFHFMHIISRLPGPWMLIEFIYYCVYTLFMLIAAIVAAANGWRDASIGAAAFFCFAALAVLAVDTFMMFRTWQAGRQSSGQSANTATITTTTTTREQY